MKEEKERGKEDGESKIIKISITQKLPVHTVRPLCYLHWSFPYPYFSISIHL